MILVLVYVFATYQLTGTDSFPIPSTPAKKP